MNTEKPRVVALWGAHRRPAKGVPGLPSSLDKGIQELADLGHEIFSVYPLADREALPGWLSRLLRGRALYKTSTLKLLTHIRRGDVLYTSDNIWCGYISRLKKWGIVKNRLIFKWAGFDAPWSEMARGKSSPAWCYYAHMLSGADVIYFASERQRQLVCEHYPELEDRLFFWPTAVDVGYYQKYRSPDTGERPYFVAVGSDCKRDWPFIYQLALKGIALKVVTNDARVKQLPEQMGVPWPENLTLEFDVGLARSAELIAKSTGIVISTVENDRFSGSTTVGVAAALGKPLILDEQLDLAAYGLEPGRNCEWFPRGDLDAAFEILTRLLADAAHAQQLGTALQNLTSRFDTITAARVLSAACFESTNIQLLAQEIAGS